MTTASPPAAASKSAAPEPVPAAPPGEGGMRKMNGRRLAGSVLGRALNPGHLLQAGKLHWHRKADRRKYDDTRLALYAQILPGDFLHYGYFDDAARRPETISFGEMSAAQVRYAELLLELIGPPAGPVLDVGCGMGGLARMLRDAGHEPTALTPDRLQVSYVTKQVPGIPVIRAKFEALDVAQHAAEYAAVVTAESLQYIKLDRALQVIDAVLRPGGAWVACDYFKTQPAPDDKTCHNWDHFAQTIAAAGWRVSYQRDVTAHVLPFLGFIHMLATRFGLPLMEFTVLRLRRKQPGLHHLLGGLIGQLEGVANDNVGLIDPTQFARDRRYMLLKLERA